MMKCSYVIGALAIVVNFVTPLGMGNYVYSQQINRVTPINSLNTQQNLLLAQDVTKQSGKQVGHGFRFTHYFVGDWTGDGTSDLIVRSSNGDLLLYPFRNGTFSSQGGGKKVGHDFSFTHYFVGNWTGNGPPDLIVRSSKGLPKNK